MTDTIRQTFEKVKERAKKDHADVELLISGSERINLSYQKKKLDKFDSSQSQMAGFRVIANSCQGYAYTENLSEDSLLKTYQEALQNAKVLSEMSGPQSITPKLIQNKALSDEMKDLDRPQNVSMAAKHQVAQDLEAKTMEQDKRISGVPYSGFSEAKSWKRILNSNGVDREFHQSYYTSYVYPLAKEGESSKMSGEELFRRDFNELNIGELTQNAAKKSLSLLGAKKLTSGKYAVILDREIAASLLHMFLDYFSAKTVSEGKSILTGKLNQQVAAKNLTLMDDPFARQGTAVRPFDDEGSPSQKITLIENGVLKNFLTNSTFAEMMKLPNTAHASRSPAGELDISCSNVIVEKGNQSFEQMLSKHDKVIHLTVLQGFHSGFKHASGDFSLPGEGFLYEKGVKQGPVDQFVVSGNILDVLNKIEALGNEYNRPGDQVLTPDLLISEMSFA